MKMHVQMYFECEKCGAGVRDWWPASFGYADGCYTVLTLNKEPPKCACETKPTACLNQAPPGPGPDPLPSLCSLPAGHAGQHEEHLGGVVARSW